MILFLIWRIKILIDIHLYYGGRKNDEKEELEFRGDFHAEKGETGQRDEGEHADDSDIVLVIQHA